MKASNQMDMTEQPLSGLDSVWFRADRVLKAVLRFADVVVEEPGHVEDDRYVLFERERGDLRGMLWADLGPTTAIVRL